MEFGKGIQCWSNASQHIPIYLQPLAFNATDGDVPIEIPEKSLFLRKLESWGYQEVKTV